jgi:hypothetical protein
MPTRQYRTDSRLSSHPTQQICHPQRSEGPAFCPLFSMISSPASSPSNSAMIFLRVLRRDTQRSRRLRTLCSLRPRNKYLRASVPKSPHTNKNSFVRNSLIMSLNNDLSPRPPRDTQRSRRLRTLCSLPPMNKYLRASVPKPPHTNKNSFVRSSLIMSRNLAAASNSNRLAASRISFSSFAM